jgi:hypothetical protein
MSEREETTAMSGTNGPQGRMTLQIHGADGTPVAERQAGNIVLRQGAELVADLFAGVDGAGRIDRVQVGFGTEAADVGATALTTPEDGTIDPDALDSPVDTDDFAIATDAQARLVRVSIAATFAPTVDLDDVSEAGLLAGDQLYNQVVFEPVDMRVGQDITLFWEVDFPFGH